MRVAKSPPDRPSISEIEAALYGKRTRRNKYNVAPPEQRTADGIVFDSKHEMECYINQFRPLMRAGVKVELQKSYALFACGGMALGQHGLFPIDVCKYIADFVVTEASGQLRVYDAKGHPTPEYKLKKKWFAACYPHLRIVEI